MDPIEKWKYFSYFLNRGLLKSFIMWFDGVLLIQILVLIICLIKSKQKNQNSKDLVKLFMNNWEMLAIFQDLKYLAIGKIWKI